MVFKVKGLVLAGGNTIGTPGAINQVEGTLVCNAGGFTGDHRHSSVLLDAQGNASFNGSFTLPTDACSTSAVAFLIRIALMIIGSPTAQCKCPSRDGMRARRPLATVAAADLRLLDKC